MTRYMSEIYWCFNKRYLTTTIVLKTIMTKLSMSKFQKTDQKQVNYKKRPRYNYKIYPVITSFRNLA